MEKTVNGYKELCANLEKELELAKQSPDFCGDTGTNNETYAKCRKELDQLRQENERLQQRKNELEIMIEHYSMKGAYNLDKYKV